MAHKEFKFSDDARREMLEGINTAVKSISSTMGPGGRLVAIRRPDGMVDFTRDGITVAKNCIPLKSRFSDMGARMVKGAAQKSVQDSGDGTTCTSLLLGAMVNEGLRLVAAGHNPVNLKKGIELGVKEAVDRINQRSITVSSPKEIEQVAVISSNGDKEIGDLLRQAFEKVGNSGIITVEKAKGTTTELSVVNGYRYDKGYLSQHFATNDKLECHLEKARVLVTDIEINNVNVMTPILEAVHKQYPNEPLLVIAGNVTGDALGLMLVNHMRKTLPSCACKAPGYGNRRLEMLMDICSLTGASFVSESVGMRLEQFDISWLGGAGKVVVTAGSTTIVDGWGANEDVEARVTLIRNQISSCGDEWERKQFEERLAKLVGGVGVIYVGGFSDSEIDEKLYRWDDSLGATRAAVESGIVAGGGTCLLRISREMDSNQVSPELRYGYDIVKKVIQEPTRKIAENAGKEPAEVVLGILSNANPNYGYNAQTEKYEDLIESGVVDPTKVIRCALQNSASVAALILTTDCLIADLKDEEDFIGKK